MNGPDMRRSLKQWCASIAVLVVVVPAMSAQEIRDLIPAVRITADRPDTFLVSDLFYARAYTVRFSKHDQIHISYDRRKNSVILQPRSGFTGATAVGFEQAGRRYSIPVIVESQATRLTLQTFRFVTSSRPSRVTVAGTFNSWNVRSHELKDPTGTGEYEISVPLEPGSYLYKFFVDDRAILDPSNPEKSPTGFDDFNSVLRVADQDSLRFFLHAGSMSVRERERVLTFFVDDAHAAQPLAKEHIIALLDNGEVASADVGLRGSTFNVRLRPADLKGERTLRVMVTRDGKQTNMQRVILRDGIAAGKISRPVAWEDGIIYSVMVDRFSNGDRSNDRPIAHDSLFVQANYQGGDLRGIIRKISDGYLDTLGVNILWISPVYDNPNVAFREYPPPHRWYSGYHGYWPISDTLVEEKFGTLDDLKELVTIAHQHGIRVLLDFVAHHVHIDHPSYRDHPDWFGTLVLPDGRKNLRLWDEFRLSTWFEPYMPSFDFSKSSAAQEAVSRNALWWLKTTGADGFRHDAVKHVPNSFWRELTRRVKEEIDIPRRTKTYQIGETFGDYDLIASYVANGQLNAQFNFNLSYFAIPVFLESDRSFASLDFHMKRTLAAFGEHHLMGNIMDSHDKVRFMAYADGKVKDQGVDMRAMAWNDPPTVDHASSYKKAELYLAYMFTIPGLPVVYYGSEFGMTGADDPDNRRMMRFGDALTEWERSLLKRTQSIIRLRTDHSALRYGDFLTLRADEHVYAYLRADFNERLLVVLNKDSSARAVELRLPDSIPATRLTNVLSGSSLPIHEDNVTVEVPEYGWSVFRVE